VILDKPLLEFAERGSVSFYECMEEEFICPYTGITIKGRFIPVESGTGNDDPKHNDRYKQAKRLYEKDPIPGQIGMFGEEK